jgi:ParB family chromosome partitioning protein
MRALHWRAPALGASEGGVSVKKWHSNAPRDKDSWGTPPEWIELARQVMGGIDCDPASNEGAQRLVQAGTYYTAEDDGLKQTWKGRVWLNPPYSHPLLGQFVDALLERIHSGDVTQACVLTNNTTDTVAGQRLLHASQAALLPEGRIAFLDAAGVPVKGTRQGQALFYFGPDVKRFAEHAKPRGVIFTPAPSEGRPGWQPAGVLWPPLNALPWVQS